jgi:DHA1 family tetracycline resistance protein-like MFS transporter
MPTTSTSFRALLPLFMVIMLDVMGIVLILPALTPLILQLDVSILPSTTPLFFRDFLYGFSLAIFPLFMFVSTPILGDLSDKFGRKKIIFLCLCISTASYFISAYGVISHSFFLVLLGRAIAGLAAGTQPIANAAIMDGSSRQTKTRNLSLIVLVSSIGLILGPLIGGVTSEKNFYHGFSLATPFVLAGVLSLVNLIYLHFSYVEKKPPPLDMPIQLSKGFILFLAAFADKEFRRLSLLYFSFILAWSLYFQTIGWFLLEEYHYNSTKIGFFFGYIGVIFVLATTLFSRFALNFFKDDKSTFLFFVTFMAVGNCGTLLSTQEIYQWVWVIFSATSNVVCYTLTLGFFSNLAGKNSQGWIMGVAGALAAVTWTVGGAIAGPLGYLNIRMPFITAIILSVISFMLMWRYNPSEDRYKGERNDTHNSTNL